MANEAVVLTPNATTGFLGSSNLIVSGRFTAPTTGIYSLVFSGCFLGTTTSYSGSYIVKGASATPVWFSDYLTVSLAFGNNNANACTSTAYIGRMTAGEYWRIVVFVATAQSTIRSGGAIPTYSFARIG